MVHVDNNADAVHCNIEWRRKDLNPGQKEVIVISASSGKRVNNLIRKNIEREAGEFIFQPIDGEGDYFFYYLPYIQTGTNYPTVRYREPADNASQGWKEGIKSKKLPEAKAIEIQSISQLHSFYPMEVIATGNEVSSLLEKHQDKDFLLFPEDRYHPIRMWDDLPYRWVSEKLTSSLTDKVQQGEYYAFQVGLFASKKDIEDVDIVFSDFKSGSDKIPASAFSCFHKGGTDWTGEPLVKKVPVAKGKIQPLWMGVVIPENSKPGAYKATIEVKPTGLEKQIITLELNVQEGVIEDHGDSNPESHSRLRWLDSEIAADNEVIAPYSPMKVQGNSIQLLGRELILGSNGLPEQVKGFFTEEMTEVGKEFRPMLAEGMRFEIKSPDGAISKPKGNGIKMTTTDERAG